MTLTMSSITKPLLQKAPLHWGVMEYARGSAILHNNQEKYNELISLKVCLEAE